MEEEEVKCFQHCSKEWNIFCFRVPLTCPVCQEDVTKTPMRIPPYLVDSPFSRADYNPGCIVIKPTVGNFLWDFTNTSNLHIGVTSSKGEVHEFDERGITVGGLDWAQCLCVKLIETEDLTLWDQKLEKVVAQNSNVWMAQNYDENNHNCYDFVVKVLRDLGLERRYPCLCDRSMFCKEVILPQTHKAGQFISLYRGIVGNGFTLLPAQS